MLGNFTFSNPTKLYFGPDALQNLKAELEKYGPTVMLVYGGGSIKKNGIYDQVKKVLGDCGKKVIEDGGVMPNPSLEKLYDGIEKARAAGNVDFILAVGGGSVIDYSKGLSASIHCKEDPWKKYYVRQEEPDCPVVPVGSVLTMVGTGSEMNGGSVITNTAETMKIGKVFGEKLYPKFAILNPNFTLTLPHNQMVAGCFDIMSHIMEQYFSGKDDNTSDYLSEGLMRSLIHSSRIANKDPNNYEARSNIMWTATWALNTLLGMGKNGGDWEVHMIGHAVGAYTHATHGMTLSAVSLPYYRFVMEAGLPKFKRFAETVWEVDPKGKNDKEVAEEGLKKMGEWMKELGLAMNIKDLGAKPEMFEGIAKATIILKGGYKVLTQEDVIKILQAAYE